MSKVETYVRKAIAIAKDDTHGYSQAVRWGNPDYDCSSLVITCVQAAGIPVKDKGASYTGNMLSTFKACGFVDVTSRVNLATGSGLKRGDILLHRGKHTEIYIGNGKAVGAHISETGGITGKGGDQTGREISVSAYRNYPWTNILRYPEHAANNTTPSGSIDELASEVINGKYGNGDARRAALGDKYDAVQKRVNEILLGGIKSNRLDIDSVARAVIDGKYGNGAARVAKLRREGYNPKEVQKRVNEMLM